jgi:hypothetical protein
MQINDFFMEDPVTDESPTPSRHPFVVGLSVILLAECALLAIATIYLVIEILVAVPDSFASAVALTALTALATIWLAIVAVNVLRGRSWTRGATVVWQVLQIAVAVGFFQGLFARPDLGWLLLLPALAAIGLLFTPPVMRATARRDETA